MTVKDFERIAYFKPIEVTRTGACLQDVKFQTIFVLDRFRKELGRAVTILKNGLTTGDHRDPAHPNGEAVDCAAAISLDPATAVKAALKAGARAIGIYWNGHAYSYHLGLGPDYRFWAATKSANNAWTYHGLIVDPAKIR